MVVTVVGTVVVVVDVRRDVRVWNSVVGTFVGSVSVTATTLVLSTSVVCVAITVET